MYQQIIDAEPEGDPGPEEAPDGAFSFLCLPYRETGVQLIRIIHRFTCTNRKPTIPAESFRYPCSAGREKISGTMKYLNLILFAGMIVMNYLANALPLNGKTTGQLSDAWPNLFVPAGVTFSIWGVIYILLLIFCVLQFTTSYQVAVGRIGWLFGLTCLFNGLWIVAWHYERLPLSLILMAGLLVCLIWINIFIRDLPDGFIKAGFGVYLGWICIATIANVTALLVNYGWSGIGLSEQMWAMIMIVTGALIVSLTIWRMSNPYIGLAVVWAFAGIMIKRQADNRAIFITAAVMMIAVAVVLILSFFRRRLFSV